MKYFPSALIASCFLCALAAQAKVNFDETTLKQIAEFKSSGLISERKFVSIEPGEFMMGSADDEEDRLPDEFLHRVKLTASYELQQTEVTQFQWFEIMGDNPSRFKNKWNCSAEYYIVFKHLGREIPVCLNMPVEQLSWDDTQTFIKELNLQTNDRYGYRLPSEAEWEYAARGGTTTKYICGDIGSCLELYGVFDQYNRPGPQPAAVASLDANAKGLYDMYGNIMEWVDDIYTHDYQKLSTTNPVNCPSESFLAVSPIMNIQCYAYAAGSTRAGGRVERGGTWNSDIGSLRSAARYSCLPDRGSIIRGFRLARVMQ